MMRWLKDKKKERRNNSNPQTDSEKEDDYGFGKEKSVTLSPSSRRQLPPTPATPEEKSPHIYEEIPDIHNFIVDNERGLRHNKTTKCKTDVPGAVPELSSSSLVLKSGNSDKDEISPYMIVPVDNEVRQTPPDFHRNGTPEVHCDVIVKDTHCEILLSRKPKVSAFRLDNPESKNLGDNDTDKRAIRNNTHFCSHDRRASSSLQSAGNTSSAFSATSSGFSSASVSKINFGGASSSMTLGNLTEQTETYEGKDCLDTDEKGVITYSTASNFIPRATKLVFNPLPGKNPCKEAFGSDSSDELNGVRYSAIKVEDFASGRAGFVSSRDQQLESKCVTYTTIETHDNLDNQVTYASVQESNVTASKTKPNCSFNEHTNTQYKLQQSKSVSTNPSNENFNGGSRTGIIQPTSPSNSSTCIYALVTFPTEPNQYNTIAEITSADFTENRLSHEKSLSTDSVDIVYSSISGHYNDDISGAQANEKSNENKKSSKAVFLEKSSFYLSEAERNLSQGSTCNFNEGNQNGFKLNVNSFDSNSRIYREFNDRIDLKTKQDLNNGPQQNSCISKTLEFHTSTGHCDNGIQLDFCFCSDEQSSSCGCPESKNGEDDDDLASIAGAASEVSNSCRSCGRLIRQITYSESYSDETYDHVYSSRLLIRSGRRFSSPDITFSEASNFDHHDILNQCTTDNSYTLTRDDSCTLASTTDIIPPPYSISVEPKMFKKIDYTQQSVRHNFSEKFEFNESKMFLKDQFNCQVNSSHLVQQKYPNLQISNPASELFSKPNTLSSCSKNSSSTSAKQLSMQQNNESSSLQIGDVSIFDNSGKSLINFNPDQSSCIEPSADDKLRKQDLCNELEQKSGGFQGFLKEISRSKSSKAGKLKSLETNNSNLVLCEKVQHCEQTRSDKDLEEIPEKNTKKLSKFFQQLSSKESRNNTFDLSTPPDNNESAISLVINDVKQDVNCFKLHTTENIMSMTYSQKSCRSEKKNAALLSLKTANETPNYKTSPDFSEKRTASHARTSSFGTQNFPTISATTPNHQLADTINILSSEASNVGEMSNMKSSFKTDSGDTCYEYDISTSSEGEQTAYEYFLSKVKKTLNLEQEAQQIAESSLIRRKRLCRRCIHGGMYSSIDDNDDDVVDRDGLCPHLAMKFGDIHAVFEDLVIDQRAVILDCLNDYNLSSPYGSKGLGNEGCCRECGCEILATESESLSTICSLLSQQFRMISPSGQTLSCDSDEGTMADNSCESAEENGENMDNITRNHYDGNSSGYDEPKGKTENFVTKLRKKERREKKSAPSGIVNSNTKHTETMNLTLKVSIDDDLPTEVKVGQPLKNSKKTTLSSVFSESNRKGILKKNSSPHLAMNLSKHTVEVHPNLGPDLKNDHSRACNINRSRTTSLTDKVLQDIYMPLPSKALSLLTSRNNGGLTCTCGKGSVITKVTHGASDKTVESITGCAKTESSSANVSLCNGDSKIEFVIAQNYYDKDKQKNSELSVINNNPINKQLTLYGNSNKEDKANNGSNNDSTDSHTSQTQSHHTRKEQDTGVKMLRNVRDHPPAMKPFESTARLECCISKSLNEEIDKCAPATLLQSTNDSLERDAHTESKGISSSDNVCSEKYLGRLHECSLVEKGKDTEYTRKHRLKIVALDLLPESVVDGDTVTTTQSQHKRVTNLPKKSKVIEKMAQLFESNSDNINAMKITKMNKVSSLDKIKTNNSNQRNTVSEKNISTVENQNSSLQQNNNKILLSKDTKSQIAKQKFTGASSLNLTPQGNLCDSPENLNLNLNTSPPAKIGGKIPRSRSRSKQVKEDETKSKSDNESTRLKPELENAKLKSELENTRLKSELKHVKVKTDKSKIQNLTESRLVKQKSPTPSSSSVSSTSSSKQKSGHTKHKPPKKSYHRKRSKHRSEHTKYRHTKEERTYYYFSSDFSDIDVVEVESCDHYSKITSNDSSHKNKSRNKRKQYASNENLLKSSSENTTNQPTSSSQGNNHGAEGEICQQEVYSIPESSPDLNSRNSSNSVGQSPQPSPELTKYRKINRTDLYKSRKSNNKLLSDVIMRNYDMQVYGNV